VLHRRPSAPHTATRPSRPVVLSVAGAAAVDDPIHRDVSTCAPPLGPASLVPVRAVPSLASVPAAAVAATETCSVCVLCLCAWCVRGRVSGPVWAVCVSFVCVFFKLRCPVGPSRPRAPTSLWKCTFLENF
jgi:hypothetical protein